MQWGKEVYDTSMRRKNGTGMTMCRINVDTIGNQLDQRGDALSPSRYFVVNPSGSVIVDTDGVKTYQASGVSEVWDGPA
ncbi:hypothetical protein SKAU_G00336550 [Synaphobranchus kaupii]|uniref:Uncharacterized protein n=1 Tax=Synaphobranchus kaupii TaxID=118154 RepID=A0A9Q1EM88_SYNKA|nr:hypothetical protein SKAU_G00336550 [Synaphobranchus kaupii]